MATLRQAQDERGGEETRQGAEGGAGGPPPEADVVKPIPRIRVKAGALARALRDVGEVIEGANTIPILGNVLFQAIDGRIVLTGSDLDCWLVRELLSDDLGQPDSADWRAGSCNFGMTVPARVLTAVLGEIEPDAMVTIELVDRTNVPSGAMPPVSGDGYALIKAGRVRVKLACLPVSDFPLPPTAERVCGFDMACSALADHFARIAFAISTEETRYYLNGIFVHAHQEPGQPQQLRMAATDGHRLARIAAPMPPGGAPWDPAIVARKTVAVLKGLLAHAIKSNATAMVAVEQLGGGTKVRFGLPAADDGEVTLVAKTIDGTFPDYTRVIPADPALTARLGRESLAAAVKRVMVLADGKSRIVKAEFAQDKVTLSSRSADTGEAVEELPCAYEGPAIAVGFDGRYWREALGAVATDEVAMRFGGAGGDDPGAPCRIEAVSSDGGEPALVQVLMPVRV